MNNPSKKTNPPQTHSTNEVILIDDPQPHQQFDFQSLHEQNSLPQQQQQVIPIYQEVGQTLKYNQFTAITPRNPSNAINASNASKGPSVTITQKYPFVSIPESQLQKQFQEIRFGQTECNLIDLDMQEDQRQKSVLQLTPYEYEKFIFNRSIDIQTPLLINQGYIMSYKLYQIKTRVIEQNKQSISKEKGIKQGQKNNKQLYNKQLPIKQNKKDQTQNKEYDTWVSRRFSDFEYLNQLLISKYGGYIIPLLPQKNFWTIVNLQGKQYAQTRTKSLVKYLTRLFTHKTLKHSQQLKDFLFQQDSKFSTQKGQYLQKKNRIEDKIISISSGALQYGKALYSRFIGQKSTNQQEIRLTKSKLTKEDLTFSQYDIVVAELIRIIADLKALVHSTIQQMQNLDDINTLFSSPLTHSFNIPTSAPISIPTSAPTSIPRSTHENSSTLIPQPIPTQQLSQQFQQISQFISSCQAAIQRRKFLRQQIQQLKQQQQFLQQKYKNSPRSLQLDVVRSKLSKLNKMNETYADELIKELEFHVDQGKGMLRLFVVKFENVRKTFFTHPI